MKGEKRTEEPNVRARLLGRINSSSKTHTHFETRQHRDKQKLFDETRLLSLARCRGLGVVFREWQHALRSADAGPDRTRPTLPPTGPSSNTGSSHNHVAPPWSLSAAPQVL